MPPHAPFDVFERCVEEHVQPEMRDHYNANGAHVAQAIVDYQTASNAVAWFNLPRVPRGSPGRIIAGTLTKGEMTSLYSNCMVGTSGAARRIYDEIMVSASGQCPFCGGIGQVFTLDHFLPKSSFPIYSVLPANLVPCCRDCNHGKNSAFGTTAGDQPLHPYLDDPKFFSQRWVHARVDRSSPARLHFYCAPPLLWSPTEQARVQCHFDGYKLAYRFSIQAGAELARVVDLRNGALRGITNESFRDYLLECAGSRGFDLNGWNRTTYTALAGTDWFWRNELT